MARRRLTPDQARAELQRREAGAIADVTPEKIAAGHAAQLEILSGDWQSLILMCSRRAGKSIVCVALCILTALRVRNVRCLYLSLTAEQSSPRFEECKAMLDRWRIAYTPNGTDQTVTLLNGSRIRFTGIDDKRRAGVFKGDQLASGIAIVDEAQDDPGLLAWLLKDVLDPMVSETTLDKPVPGRIVVAGVVPESEAGYFWDLWQENHERPGSSWLCMGWGRADNPHELDFRRHLDAYLAKYNLAEDDPIVQRNWHGRRVFDKNVTAYRYNVARNSYIHVPAPWLGEFKLPANDSGVTLGTLLASLPAAGVTDFGVGIDPASRRDCCAINVWGWGAASADVWQVAEFVTAPASGIRQDQWIDVLLELRRFYPNLMGIQRDAGSAAEDIVLTDYKLRIEAVVKGPGSVKDRVERTAALLGQGRAHVMAGSQLEQQLKAVRWDPAARERGKWVLLPTIPNDVSDAGDYGLVPYHNAFEPKKAPETAAEMHERLFKESFVPPVKYGYQEDPALATLLGE